MAMVIAVSKRHEAQGSHQSVRVRPAQAPAAGPKLSGLASTRVASADAGPGPLSHASSQTPLGGIGEQQHAPHRALSPSPWSNLPSDHTCARSYFTGTASVDDRPDGRSPGSYCALSWAR